YAYGKGVRSARLKKHFETRDFTMNELAIVEGQLLLTRQAYEDLESKTIRFSAYETGRDGSVKDKLYRKAELMECVFQEYFETGMFVREGIFSREPKPFNYALALNKAFQYGERVTARFLGCMAD